MSQLNYEKAIALMKRRVESYAQLAEVVAADPSLKTAVEAIRHLYTYDTRTSLLQDSLALVETIKTRFEDRPIIQDMLVKVVVSTVNLEETRILNQLPPYGAIIH